MPTIFVIFLAALYAVLCIDFFRYLILTDEASKIVDKARNTMLLNERLSLLQNLKHVFVDLSKIFHRFVKDEYIDQYFFAQ